MQSQKITNWRTRHELRRLAKTPHPPKELFYSGKWNPAIFDNCVAIVGSRRMTQYGRRVIEQMVPRLVFEKKTIVSGFMYGVDHYAHKICVESGGKTIAVLGWGIGEPLADEEKLLAKSIICAGGLLLSEWENQKPTLWTFPVRNRIVAALARDVIVVEAAAKSGSLITARIARELKRKLWAVPGPIISPMSVGTNALIANGTARMWLGDAPPMAGQAHSSDPLINALAGEELTANEVARKLNQPVSKIGAQLSLLLSGQLVEREGKYTLINAYKN